MLSRQDISVDCDSPSLIDSRLAISSHTIDHWCQFRSKQEDVDTTIGGDLVKVFNDGLLENAGGKIANKLAVDINVCASLLFIVKIKARRGEKGGACQEDGNAWKYAPERWGYH